MSNTLLPSNEQRRLLEQATLAYMKNVEDAEVYLKKRAIPLQAARSAGVGVVDSTVREYKNYKGRLWIPYLTDAGPVNAVMRCMSDHDCKKQEGNHGKYIRVENLGVNLYGVQSYHDDTDFMCITEGEMDALTLKVMGIPAMGVPGSENWKDHWTAIFDDFPKVYVFGDGDDAGRKYAQRVAKATGATKVIIPEGYDVNKMFAENGFPFFKEALGL